MEVRRAVLRQKERLKDSPPPTWAGNFTCMKKILFILLTFPIIASADVGEVSFYLLECPSGTVEVAGQDVAYAPHSGLTAPTAGYEALVQSTVAWPSVWRSNPTSYPTRFLLPDLRGEFLRAFDNGRGVDKFRVYGSTQADSVQGHKHRVEYSGGAGAQTGYLQAAGQQWGETNLGIFHYAGTVYDNGYGTVRISTETRSRNVALKVCIQLQKEASIVNVSSVTITAISTGAITALGNVPVDVNFQTFIFSAMWIAALLWGIKVGAST